MSEPASSFVDAEGVRLHYLAWDPEQARQGQAFSGGPGFSNEDAIPLVLLHGLGATAETWRLAAEHVHSERLVVAFDLRGHGQSDHPEEGYELATIAEDIVRGMAELGLGQVALAGHGWGARVALVLAAHHPALISHLILVDCPHVEPRHWPGMVRERFINERSPQAWYASRVAYLDLMQKEMFSFWSPQVEAIVSSYVRDLPNGQVEELLSAENQRRIREALWDDRALSYYGKLHCPVLLVPAASPPRSDLELPERLENADEFATAKGYMAAQVARMIPRCTVMWMPNTSHDIQLQRPLLLAQAMVQFLKE